MENLSLNLIVKSNTNTNEAVSKEEILQSIASEINEIQFGKLEY